MGCQQTQTKQLSKYLPAATGFFHVQARRQTMHLPISPQWNGLMPPDVQLNTTAVLGLRGEREEGHHEAKNNTCQPVFYWLDEYRVIQLEYNKGDS